jgi:hypothetical protein
MALTISKVKIANMALSNLGTRSTIEDFSEESPEAQQADLHYEYARAVALSAFPWGFAKTRLTLATHGDAAPDPWSYRYQYPADCLVAREIVNPLGHNYDPIPFGVEMSEDGTTKSIVTDQDDAVLVYTFDQDVTSLFTPYFVRCLSFMLAHLMAQALTGKQSTASDMWNQFRFLIGQAEASDANEGHPQKKRESEWTEDRS